MPRTYVDNAYNRSVGRVGMPVGSAVISRSSGGGGGYSGGYASSSSGTYVDNAYNRSVGRVGLPLGSAVMSRSSSGGGGGYSAGSASSSSRTYVDNAFNRSVGRVGLPLGSAVISRSSSGGGGSSLGIASTSRGTYVDNPLNRSLGRVGMEYGTAVESRSGRIGSSSGACAASSGSTKVYVDNALNRRLGRVGLPHGSAVYSKSGAGGISVKTYVDNEMNRRLGRVGMPLGTATVRSSRGDSDRPKVYVDNYFNRKHGRVGKPLGSHPISCKCPETNMLRDVYQHLRQCPDEEMDWEDKYVGLKEEDYLNAVDRALDMFNHVKEVRKWQDESKTTEKPKTSPNLLKDFTGKIIRFEEIELRGKIGGGGFGDVYFAKYRGSVLAVKKLRVQRVSKRRLQAFTDEVILLADLDHPNIVRFIGACVITPNLCICMEYMNMTVYEAMHVKEIEFEEGEKLDMMAQVASGLAYLHRKNIAHCDMKSQNVLLDYEPKKLLIAKITDFGLSMMKKDAETSSSNYDEERRNVGTPRYSAPEVLRGEMLNLKAWMKADIYSYSLIAFEVACEEEPFYGLSYLQMVKQVGQGRLTPEFPRDITLDRNFADQLKSCWKREASGRPSAQEMVSFMREAKILYQN